MGGTQSSLIPWRNSILMLLVGAFTMEGLYKGCVKKPRLCPSNIFNPYVLYIYNFASLFGIVYACY